MEKFVPEFRACLFCEISKIKIPNTLIFNMFCLFFAIRL
jgi:hypothetical protein